jgi:hypothetical protein
MQHTQGNYRNFALGALLVVGMVFAGKSAFSAGIADPAKPDPILSGTADGPCDPALASPDLTPGTDVEGHQVASADIQGGPIPFQGQVLVPLKDGKNRPPAYVGVDGKKLDPLLNPKPACH